ITHEACRNGVTPQRDAIQNVPMARFQWLMGQLQTLPVLVIPEVEELPSEAEEEKLEFQREGIRSLVLVGLKLEGQVRGILGFDFLQQSRVLDSETEEFVLQVGEVLGASVHRQILASRNVRFENSLYR
ncbi:MAG TPA: diguanylate cyclase, partial [Candidatus Latescibacteria bacterium]|nr:diguanylate cyclase [Candidatus Latescibacterota bacterium]